MSHEPLTEKIKDLLVTQFDELPVFHPVALKLQRMLASNDFTVYEVAEVATEDQALASQMLKVANAPLYAGRTKVATLKEAITRLGAQQIINIAFAASQASAHVTHNPHLAPYLEALWLHSHAAAVGSRWLSCRCGLTDMADQLYLAGLLHDVGKLYVLKAIEHLFQNGELEVLPDRKVMLDTFGALHVEQGHQLLRRWDFPDLYCEVVRDHHLDALDPLNKMLVVVRFVNMVCHKIGVGLQKEPDLDLLETPESSLLEVSQSSVDELVALLLESSLWSRGIA